MKHPDYDLHKVYIVIARINGNKKVMRVYRYEEDAKVYASALYYEINKNNESKHKNPVKVLEKVVDNCFDPYDVRSI